MRRLYFFFICVSVFVCGPGSSVGIVTCYGLDGLRIESRYRLDFPHLFRPAVGPTQPPVQWVPALSRGKERPGRDADPDTLLVPWSCAMSYPYSSYGPYGLYRASVPAQGCTLTFFFMSSFICAMPTAKFMITMTKYEEMINILRYFQDLD